MSLELPNGDRIEPGDVVLYEGYPYRYVDVEDDRVAFVFSPVYWGDSPLDIPFQSAADLRSRWGDESRGVLSADEWAAWLSEARTDPQFSDEELEAIAGIVSEGPERSGLLGRLRRLVRAVGRR